MIRFIPKWWLVVLVLKEVNMSDFLFIIPEGWTQLSKEATDYVGASSAQILADTGNMYDLTAKLQEGGFLVDKQYLIEAKLFNGEILVARLAINE